MKIGVLSDTHDNLANLLAVLEICREQQIDTVIHCGDLTGLEMVSHFAGFRTIFTFGNMDHVSGAIKNGLKRSARIIMPVWYLLVRWEAFRLQQRTAILRVS